MKISEYTILEDAFHNSFGFMLNRLADLGFIRGDPHDGHLGDKKDTAEERCFNEFVAALEDMGVMLQDVGEPLKTKP
jgi:hypothetical protein